MTTSSDVIIIGGGPSGSYAAYRLGKLGANVTILEEHTEIGLPAHCAGHLSINGLKKLGLYPLPRGIVENAFRGAVFHSPNGKTFSVHFSAPITCAVNRALFDKHIADMAEKAAVSLRLGSRVESLVLDHNLVRGVVARREGRTETFHARIVVDAEGISSRLVKQAGLDVLNRLMVVNAAQAEVDGVKDVETDTVEVFLGREYAQGFYVWLIPKGEGRARVGLASNFGNPKELLGRFMSRHPVASRKLASAKTLHMAFHPITLGGPIRKPYSNGFLAVGDAASHVKPTTGGGVVFGMTGAGIAAGVVREALRENDVSSEFLSRYKRRCDDVWGFDVRVMLRMRRFLDSMPDKKIDDAIALCSKLGLDKTLQTVDDIDFQGRTLLRVFRSPRIATALGYFFYLYLSANI